jgi:Fur family transcriptional regulator, ferric uptake regulator
MTTVTQASGDEVGALLQAAHVRYNPGRRRVVGRLRVEGRPMSADEVRRAEPTMPYSSIYRTLSVLTAAGVIRRLGGLDGLARFELAEEVSRHHHHHLVCADCGTMDTLVLSDSVEAGLDAAAAAARRGGFVVDSHRVELIGRCGNCAAPMTQPARRPR